MSDPNDIKARAYDALKDCKSGISANPALVIAAIIDGYPNSAVDWSVVEKTEAYCNEIISAEQGEDNGN